MHRFASTALVLLLPILAAPSQVRAEFVFNPANGHSYGLTSGPLTWDEAEAEAVALGGHLVAVADQSEQDFLIDTFVVPSTPGGEAQPFWIGLHDVNQAPDVVGQDFQWTTGESLVYTAWNAGEPNNSGSIEWYVAFNFAYAFGSGPKGTWNDTYQGIGPLDTRLFRGIIELNLVPEPSSVILLGLGALGLAGGTLRRRIEGSADRRRIRSHA